MTISESITKRFWEKVDRRGDDECWEWMGSKALGYGQLSNGYKKTPLKAHRLSYEIHSGPIPKETPVICHKCNNPGCVNPSHLYAGTTLTNMADKIRTGRCNSSGLPAEANPSAKVNWEQVREIRRLHLAGQNNHEIADLFVIGPDEVRAIVLNKAWIDAAYKPNHELIADRTRKPPKLFGQANYNFKLTPGRIQQILDSPLSSCALAKIMDVSKPTILKVRKSYVSASNNYRQSRN